jgi:hypothetical protein
MAESEYKRVFVTDADKVMGINQEPPNRWRRGFDTAKKMHIGGGTYISAGDVAKSREGFQRLPADAQTIGVYNQSEIQELAFQAFNGIPDYQAAMGTTIDSICKAIEDVRMLNIKDVKETVYTTPQSALGSAFIADELGRIIQELKGRYANSNGSKSLDELASTA